MGASNIIVYVPPALFSIVSIAFFFLWRSGMILSWHWAAGFAGTALGFVLSTFSIHPMFDAFSSGMVFIAAAYCYGSGLIIHFDAPRFRSLRRGLIAVYTPLLAYLVLVEQSLVWQLFLTDASFALMLGIAVVTVARRAARRIDVALVAASTVVVFDSVLRTVFFTFFTDANEDLGDFAASAYNLAVHVSTITVCMVFPFTALGAITSAAIERHRSEAERDHLTGLLNRRGFEMSVKRTFGDQAPAGVVLVLDIDRFKQVNDVYGHAVGDRVITMLADVLHKVVAGSGHVARVGGEEFIAYLPQVSRGEAIVIGNRVRMGFERCDWTAAGIAHSVTVSAGAADVREGHGMLEHAFRLADEALYAAKSSGRNRVIAAGRDLEEGIGQVTPKATISLHVA